MTTIKIYRKDTKVMKYRVSGHSGYSNSGNDIVCSAISAIVQTAALGLIQVAGISVEYKMEEAFFECIIPYDIDNTKRANADVILETMILGIKEFDEEYSKYVRVLELEV